MMFALERLGRRWYDSTMEASFDWDGVSVLHRLCGSDRCDDSLERFADDHTEYDEVSMRRARSQDGAS